MSTVANGLPASAQDVLARNLAALDRVDPALAARVRLPVDGGRTRWDETGQLVHRLHRTWIPLGVGPDECEALIEEASGATAVLVLGIGGGELVQQFLRTSRPILAWEHDPWILRIFLMACDVASALSTRRLRLILGIDLLQEDPRQAGLALVEHPRLGRIYASEVRLFRGTPASSRAVMCAGGLFVEEVRGSLESMGYSTWTLDIQGLAEEEIALTMERYAPDLIVAINYTDGLVEFCHGHGVKLIVWEIDPSTTPPLPVSGPTEHAHVFTFRAAHVAQFQHIGLAHAEYLPLAADIGLRRPLELEADVAQACAAPLAHVGSSMVENAHVCRARLIELWRAWAPAESVARIESVLEQVLSEQRADFAEFRIPELLEAAAPGLRAAAVGTPGAEDPVVLAGEVAASEKRLSWAANLGQLGLSVWGDDGWRATEAHGVRFRGPAGHRSELTRIYAACALHWDVGRLYQPDIVTMRVFDVLACGRPVLTERNPALEALFDLESEVIAYHGVSDLKAKAAYFIEHPDEARSIGERGREAVQARHSIGIRVAHMIACL